jgi:RimJ/RimL family protein N-acetyltransferase
MIDLVPLSEEEYQAWARQSATDYAEDNVKAGNWPASEAQQLSEQAVARYLPEGLATKDQYIFGIRDLALEKNVGVLWISIIRDGPRPSAWLSDIKIYEEFRRKGYGELAMHALEEKVRSLGLFKIDLHVFGHNHPAQALYEKMGYRITNITMSKVMDSRDAPPPGNREQK